MLRPFFISIAMTAEDKALENGIVIGVAIGLLIGFCLTLIA